MIQSPAPIDIALSPEAPSSGEMADLRSGQPDSRRWVAFASVVTGLFMVLLDGSIVNVAVPAIRTNLQANAADIQFVVAGYALAYAVMLITGGRLGDIYGRKRLFALGMAGFVLASASCGLAQSALMLDLSRVIQGLFAALMFPQVFTMVQVVFPPADRTRVFGILGAVVGLATVAGPLIGGAIIRGDLVGSSWRWIFLVNVPIGLAALGVALRVIRESRAPGATRLDIAGTLIATTGLVLGVYPLVEGQVAGWPAWTFVCIALSPLVLAAFVVYERALPPERFPLVQLSMFRIPSFSVGIAVTAVLLAGIPAFFFTFSLVLQVGLGFSALHAGLTTLPWSIATAIFSLLSMRLAPRHGRWTITVGSSLMAVGALSLVLTLRTRGHGGEHFRAGALVPHRRCGDGHGDGSAAQPRPGRGAAARRRFGVRGVHHVPAARGRGGRRGRRGGLLRVAAEPGPERRSLRRPASSGAAGASPPAHHRGGGGGRNLRSMLRR